MAAGPVFATEPQLLGAAGPFVALKVTLGMLSDAFPAGRFVMPAAALVFCVPWVSEKPSPQLRVYPYLSELIRNCETM